MMFKKLRNKFILLNMAIISVMMIAAFVVIYVMTYTNIQNENSARLQKISSIPIAQLRQPIIPGTAIGARVAGGVIPADYTLSFNVIADSGGQPISIHSFVDMPDEMYTAAVELAIASGKRTDEIAFYEKSWLFNVRPLENIMIVQGGADGRYLIDCTQISFLDITDSKKILAQLLITFGIIGFLMLFVILGISVFFARRAVAPVESAYMKQKQFITDASHELKTPIASIAANTDALTANKCETVESQQKWIDYIRTETDRMCRLVGDLLYLAKTDGSEIGTEVMPFNMSDTVRDALLSMEAVAHEKGLTLTQYIKPAIIVNGDADKLAQAVKILFDNAIKYSDEGGAIDIALKQTKHQAVFSIKNTGSGIAKEHLPLLFDRFYRADPSRAHDGSYGLGLSIAKAIIDNMGGKIYAASDEGESATFTFVLSRGE